MEFTTQLWAAFSNNPTHREDQHTWPLWQGSTVPPSHERDCHPPWCLFPKDLDSRVDRAWIKISPKTTIRKHSSLWFHPHPFDRVKAGGASDFKLELLPVHSPLLRESSLVSFPPLIDMLKFSGLSYLIWDRESKYIL